MNSNLYKKFTNIISISFHKYIDNYIKNQKNTADNNNGDQYLTYSPEYFNVNIIKNLLINDLSFELSNIIQTYHKNNVDINTIKNIIYKIIDQHDVDYFIPPNFNDISVEIIDTVFSELNIKSSIFSNITQLLFTLFIIIVCVTLFYFLFSKPSKKISPFDFPVTSITPSTTQYTSAMSSNIPPLVIPKTISASATPPTIPTQPTNNSINSETKQLINEILK